MTTTGLLRSALGTMLMLALAPVAQGADDYLLYEPKPVEDSVAPADPDRGVLIRTITIKPGDTLYKLSRAYAGNGSYYPQILLFNRIADPNLIYAGNQLKVPVSSPGGRKAATKAKRSERPAPRGHAIATVSHGSRPAGAEQNASVSAPVRSETASPAAGSDLSEQKLYEKAIAEYRSGEYERAQRSFASFIGSYPSSPLIPDAVLYRADSLLKQAELKK